MKGQQTPSLLSMDQRGQVMGMGTFSKTFCPGLRIGWLACSPDIMPQFVKVKQVRTFIRPLLIRPSLTAIWTNSALMNM